MKLSKDKIVSLVFMALSVVILALTRNVRVLPNLAEPGPRLFPQIAAMGMILCGIGMFLDKGSSQANSEAYLTGEGWKRFAVVFAVIAAYVLGLFLVGFLIATPIAMLGFVAVLRSGRKVSLIATIVIAAATTVVLYFVFEKLFAIPLPPGKLFG